MELLTVAEVAKLLKLREETVRRLLSKGLLPGCKTGRVWRIAKGDLVAKLRGNLVPAPGKTSNVHGEGGSPARRGRVVVVKAGSRSRVP